MAEPTESSPPAPPPARPPLRELEGLRSPSLRLRRLLWDMVWLLLFRPSPRLLYGWRRLLLRLFGARIGFSAWVYPSCRIWAPWNLELGRRSMLGPDVDCYSAAAIVLEEQATVSQYSYLCSATHDFELESFPTLCAPIRIGRKAWVCADAFVGPGVTVGEGAVVGARASVYADVEPWTVVGGNPARFLRRRVLRAGP